MFKLIRESRLLISQISVLFAIFNCAIVWPLEQAENCAEIYSPANFMGSQLSVDHGSTILDLSENYLNSDYDDWRNSSESVKIHEGCTLATCNDRCMEGTCEKIQTSQSTLALNYNEKIESHDCQFSTEALNLTNIQEAVRCDQYPPMIEVPANTEQITTKVAGPLRSHKGLRATLLSSQHGRNPKNAYILHLGIICCGKSAMINSLFDNASIAEVGETESAISEIHEYPIPAPIPESEID